MTEASLIETKEWPGFERRGVQTAAGPLSLRLGNAGGTETVLFNHSILTGSAIWHRQARREFRQFAQQFPIRSPLRQHSAGAVQPSLGNPLPHLVR